MELPTVDRAEEAVCFVCLDASGPLLQPCACRSYVHIRCQRQLLEKTTSCSQGVCSVCKSAYKNVEEVTAIEADVPVLVAIGLLASMLVLCLAVGTWLTAEFVRGDYSARYGMSTCFAAAFVVLALLLIIRTTRVLKKRVVFRVKPLTRRGIWRGLCIV